MGAGNTHYITQTDVLPQGTFQANGLSPNLSLSFLLNAFISGCHIYKFLIQDYRIIDSRKHKGDIHLGQYLFSLSQSLNLFYNTPSNDHVIPTLDISNNRIYYIQPSLCYLKTAEGVRLFFPTMDQKLVSPKLALCSTLWSQTDQDSLLCSEWALGHVRMVITSPEHSLLQTKLLPLTLPFSINTVLSSFSNQMANRAASSYAEEM